MPSPIEQVHELPASPGSVVIWWLGQAGFIVRGGDSTFLVDPFLSPHDGRLYQSALTPAETAGVDAVLCTHEHVDHFDATSAPAIASASPDALFVVPTPIVDMVTEVGIAPNRVIGMQPGETVELGDLTVRAVPAKHGVTMKDAYGFGEELSDGLVRFLGYVVDAGGVRLYHAGDTIHYEGMGSTLRDLRVDAALLPINGRDPAREARGIVGNLTEREAAWLAKEIEAGVVIPMHHDMFERNRGYPELLVESVERDHPGVAVLVPARDVPFVLSSARRR